MPCMILSSAFNKQFTRCTALQEFDLCVQRAYRLIRLFELASASKQQRLAVALAGSGLADMALVTVEQLQRFRHPVAKERVSGCAACGASIPANGAAANTAANSAQRPHLQGNHAPTVLQATSLKISMGQTFLELARAATAAADVVPTTGTGSLAGQLREAAERLAEQASQKGGHKVDCHPAGSFYALQHALT